MHPRAVRRRHLARTVAFAILVASSAAPPVAAGECAGMVHYEYDGGECIDKSGDTTDVLIRSGNESYRMGLQQIDRSRPGFGAGAGGGGATARGPSRELYRAAGKLLVFKIHGRSLAPERVTAQSSLKDPARRRRLLEFYRNVVDDWQRNAHAYGFEPRSLPAARLYFVESAFHALDGRWPRDPHTPRAVQFALIQTMVYNTPLLQRSDAEKQELSERYVMYAGMLNMLSSGLIGRSGGGTASERRALRDFAAAVLHGDLGIARPDYPIDRLPCAMLPPMPFTSCEARLQFYGA